MDIGKQSRSVTTRARAAAANGCDAVISLHHNAGGGRGITLFRHINGVMGSKSLNLQNSIYKYLKNVNAGNRSKPIAQAELGVINCNTTKCPAILIECAFMDNAADVKLIKTSSYNDKLADGIVHGVCDYFSVAYKGNVPTTTTTVKPSTIAVKHSYKPWAYTRVVNVPKNDVLNVRNAPNANATLIRTLGNGNEVDTIEVYTNGWAKINITGQQGYVNASYLNINAAAKKPAAPVYKEWVAVTYNTGSAGLNVRTGAGVFYPKLKEWSKLYDGNLVAVIGETGNWYKIRIAGKYVGYASKDYLKRA